MANWGIRKRVLFLALAPAAALALLLSAYFTHTRLSDLEQALRERGFAIARQLAPASEYGVFSGNREQLHMLATAALWEADMLAVTIRGADGAVLAQSGHPGAAPPPSPDVRQPVLLREGRTVLVIGAPILQSQTALEEFFDYPQGDGARVLGWVTVEISKADMLARKNRLLLASLLLTLAGLAAGAMLALRMSRGVTRPVLRLAATVEKIGKADLGARVPADSSGELLVLEKGVNAMAEALESLQHNLEKRIHAATAELHEKKEEAERANEAKSRFLAAASHDLRQPMHALGMFVTELGMKAHSAETRRLAAQIEASVLAMEDLLDALLDISRLDAGALIPNIGVFPVGPLLERMESDFAAQARAKGLKFRVVPSGALVSSDLLLLERVLRNLLCNAVRYTPQGGILVGCRRRGGRVRIEVRDSGIGIPLENQRAVFQEFFQLDNPERDRQKGLGLGLAIVERLARLLDHKLELVSLPGRGSVFAIELPLGEAPHEPPPPAPLPQPRDNLKNTLVVVIDDEKAAREGMCGLLEHWGCRVICAASGGEALQQLAGERQTPGAIVCDYHLAGQENGMQALERLRALFSGPVAGVLVSGDTAPELLRRVRSAGYEMLHKPVRPAKLRALLSHLLAGADSA